MTHAYFSFDPDDGFDTHETPEQAKEACDQALQYHRDEAACDGWPENTSKICWGKLHQKVEMVSEIDRPPASQLDEVMCDDSGNDWSNSDWDKIQDFQLKSIE